LKTIDSAFASSIEQFSNLLVVPDIAAELDALHMSWRRAVALSLACGSPVPCLSAALTYYDSYRSHTSLVGIIRAQRDFFGCYGFDRFDKEGWFTSNWTREHTKWVKKEMKVRRQVMVRENIHETQSW
jgi:6-phosphogluconate dehydrogenase